MRRVERRPPESRGRARAGPPGPRARVCARRTPRSAHVPARAPRDAAAFARRVSSAHRRSASSTARARPRHAAPRGWPPRPRARLHARRRARASVTRASASATAVSNSLPLRDARRRGAPRLGGGAAGVPPPAPLAAFALRRPATRASAAFAAFASASAVSSRAAATAGFRARRCLGDSAVRLARHVLGGAARGGGEASSRDAICREKARPRVDRVPRRLDFGVAQRVVHGARDFRRARLLRLGTSLARAPPRSRRARPSRKPRPRSEPLARAVGRPGDPAPKRRDLRAVRARPLRRLAQGPERVQSERGFLLRRRRLLRARVRRDRRSVARIARRARPPPPGDSRSRRPRARVPRRRRQRRERGFKTRVRVRKRFVFVFVAPRRLRGAVREGAQRTRPSGFSARAETPSPTPSPTARGLDARELVLPAPGRFSSPRTPRPPPRRRRGSLTRSPPPARRPRPRAARAARRRRRAANTFRMSVIGELELVGCSSPRRGVPSRVAAEDAGGGERAAGTSRPVSKPMSAATAVVGLGVASGPGAGPVDPLSPL